MYPFWGSFSCVFLLLGRAVVGASQFFVTAVCLVVVVVAWSARSRRRGELPADWVRLRRRVLVRDGFVCQWPGCVERATDVDHIVRGSDHSLLNLRSLCHHHHMQRTGADGGRAGSGKRKGRRRWDRWERPHPAFK